MIPNRRDIEIPLLEVLHEKGGQVAARDAATLVAHKFPNLSQDDLEIRLSSGRNQWKTRVRSAQQRLAKNGDIDRPVFGVWRITDKGRERLSSVNALIEFVPSRKKIKGTLVSGKNLQQTKRLKKRRLKSDTLPGGERFEDEIWLLMESLGFTELNQSNQFSIDVSIPGNLPSPEQIDVFARDGENHVFLVECKFSETHTHRTRELKGAIDKFKAHDSRLRNSVRRFFGDEKKKRLKITYVVASRNIAWSDPLLQRARNANVFIWKDEDIDQLWELGRLHNLIGDAVKYQLYASMFRGQSIRSLENQQVAAIRGKAGDYSYYQFIATPEQLLPIAFVPRRLGKGSAGFDEVSDSYQRILNRTKVKAIGGFIDSRRYFPNNIIISFDEEPRFDPAGKKDFRFRNGVLSLPNRYGSAWIIDGQHRLYGFANSNKGDSDPIPVIAFSRLSVSDQARLFVEINRNQTNVGPNLMWDLYGDIYLDSDEDSQIEDLTISNIVKLLDTMASSPLQDHVFIPSHGKKSKTRNVTMSTVCQSIKKNNILNILTNSSKQQDREDFESFAANRIALFFEIASNLHLADWNKGNDGYLRSNNGIAGLLIVFKELLLFFDTLSRSRSATPLHQKSKTIEFASEVERLLRPAIEHLRADPNRSKEFRRRAGLSGQMESAIILLSEIQIGNPDFYTPLLGRLTEQPNKASQVSDNDLDQLLKLTEVNIRNFIVHELRKRHGDAWYRQGVPGNVKDFIKSRIAQEITNHPYKASQLNQDIDSRLQFTNLMHLKDIILYGNNWKYFKRFFGRRENIEVHFRDFSNLRNASSHARQSEEDIVVVNRGRTSITWLQLCIDMAEIEQS